MKRWDVFCKIVDNFGDIGVCWRLACQLRQAFGIHIRLWIDDLHTAKQLIPALDSNAKEQTINDISIALWTAGTHFDEAAPVVIEAFGCELPASYLALMQASSVWINLEYLSAEHWVADFHTRHSVRGPLNRYFFFPGFTEDTGGLIREQHNLLQRTDTENLDAILSTLNCQPDSNAIKVSLFSYQHAQYLRCYMR